jgi:DNA polymerase-1
VILSHFKTKDTFIELDYAQLEIRVLALATRDKKLVEDLVSGRDMHTYFASRIFDKKVEDVTQPERKLAKGFSFQLQYGAGFRSIAESWNVAPKLVKGFIRDYYTRYATVKKWQEKSLKEAEASFSWRGESTKDSLSIPSYYLSNIWGEEEAFFLLADKWKGEYKVSPTKVKNYPIQGAGADIMFMMLGVLDKELSTSFDGRVRMLNTVHDSVLLEVPDCLVDDVVHAAQQSLESVPEELHRLFGVNSPVAFPVDYSIGKTLAEVKHAAA